MLLNFSWLEKGQIAGMGQPQNQDIEVLYDQGIRCIVSLTEWPLDREALLSIEMNYLHVPILDMQSPTLQDVIKTIDFVERQIQQNCPTVLHCGAGIGRTGTMLACFLVKRQYAPEDALARVRLERPGSVETSAQESVVYEYAKYINDVMKQPISQN
tara:strand:+ start:392 stop:862 length:471 start_codon:yes stop_codon:yes gene_type:complete